ncbi:bucentaur or craniofacial development-domain-containing protein [Gamsiella multidivaricata]|uniref:bucentaur or craniofacial development-domain-containing protein n=1 Tax=Gamsiella multidivaricata TaxID=101098 RepID=UPI00221F70BE|nr:bucentaur or craniofacial development-domain-containing protein [Gamsiella multidivaricata]KAI7826891.1 bucentaur or craniofacial development-domain-containing protein [Gamsiella multidivaricata]
MAKQATEKPVKPDFDSDSDSSDDDDYVPDDKADLQSEGDDDSDDSDIEQSFHDPESGAQEDSHTTTRSGKCRATDTSSDLASKKHKLNDTDADQAQALAKKSKLDALWAELNAPVAKPSSRPEILTLGSSGPGSAKADSGMATKMVTITTTYDFAGEAVTVTKDVPEGSKEAKEFALKNKAVTGSSTESIPTTSNITAVANSIPLTTSGLTTEPSSSPSSSPSSNISSSSTSTSTAASLSSSSIGPGPRVTTRPSILDSIATKKGPVRYIRKKSQLDELAATYGVKKPSKMNTLEKSKLDWKNFVGKEGIEDELKHHNKDGYMEKVAFLQRTDERRDMEYQTLKKKR